MNHHRSITWQRIRLWGLVLSLALPALAGGAKDPDPGYEPTDNEQYLVELINRARANPDAEAAFFGIDLNEGLAPGTLGNAPRQPVAIYPPCVKAARDHTVDLATIIHDLPLDHRGSDGRTVSQRLSDLGIAYSSYSENNSWSSGSKLSVKLVDKLHELLFKDFTASFEVPGRGHRLVILNGARNLVGTGVVLGQMRGHKAGVCTEDYITNGKTYLTGVLYQDADNNHFYTPGEGLGGVTITATDMLRKDVFTTATFASGGYTLEVPAGTYRVRAEGAVLPQPMTRDGVVVNDENVKIDFVPDAAGTPPSPPEFILLAGGGKRGKDGVWSLILKKVTFDHGADSFTEAQLDALEVRVDGIPYFDAATRAESKVKVKRDKISGDIVKLAIATPTKDKLAIDLKKNRLKMAVKRAVGFDPNGGDFDIEILFGDGSACLTTHGTVVKKRMILAPAEGTVTLP